MWERKTKTTDHVTRAEDGRDRSMGEGRSVLTQIPRASFSPPVHASVTRLPLIILWDSYSPLNGPPRTEICEIWKLEGIWLQVRFG